MAGTLSVIGLLWLAFNIVIGAVILALSLVRAVRRKLMMRYSSVDQLMAAHFDSVRKRSAAATEIEATFEHQLSTVAKPEYSDNVRPFIKTARVVAIN